MNKLVSRNPVLRFKLGKKIIKAEEGAVARWQRRIKSGINGIGSAFKGAFDMTFNPNNTLFGSLKIYNFTRTIPNRIINSLVVENYTPENGGTTNNRLRNRQLNNLNTAKQNIYKTPELRGSKEAYLNRLQQQGFTAKPTNKEKSLLKPLSKILNNIWIKGYNRHPEITDIRAMLKKLMELGLLKDKFGADGKWGKNTEAAYLKYLLYLNNPSGISTSQTPTIEREISPYELMSNNLENIPLYLRIIFKQGGQLISKNPIERFKLGKKIIKAQQGKNLPTAPKAEDRYKNGYKYGYRADGSIYLFPSPLYTIADIKGVRTDYPFMSNLGEIQKTIFYAGNTPMDTMYTEIPNSVFPVERKWRYANSKNKTPEYKTLKRRFNTAWNLAK